MGQDLCKSNSSQYCWYGITPLPPVRGLAVKKTAPFWTVVSDQMQFALSQCPGPLSVPRSSGSAQVHRQIQFALWQCPGVLSDIIDAVGTLNAVRTLALPRTIGN